MKKSQAKEVVYWVEYLSRADPTWRVVDVYVPKEKS